eukprot:CCRYP_008433-RA/>CCRYP_008433-RA protein AED:0.09 eAED:0.09 QI:217/1/1/1/0/0/4/831/39
MNSIGHELTNIKYPKRKTPRKDRQEGTSLGSMMLIHTSK